MGADQLWNEFVKTGSPEQYISYSRARRKREKDKKTRSPAEKGTD